MGRGLGYLHLRHQFGLTGPHLQNPAPQQEPFSLSCTTPGGPGARLLNRSLSLSLVQLQVVPEQCNLILVVFKTMTLAFHGMDLRPRDLWARVQEGALSDHVARLATPETGAHHSGGTGTIHHHGITSIGGTR